MLDHPVHQPSNEQSHSSQRPVTQQRKTTKMTKMLHDWRRENQTNARKSSDSRQIIHEIRQKRRFGTAQTIYDS